MMKLHWYEKAALVVALCVLVWMASASHDP
jgi:hypothetical protein